jgi:hypothetical protein
MASVLYSASELRNVIDVCVKLVEKLQLFKFHNKMQNAAKALLEN